jgi:kynureninase
VPNLTRASCEQLDADDPLRAWRDEFILPIAADGVAYLAGHSLGALPKRAIASVQRTVTDEWGDQAVRSWSDADWMDLPRRIGDKIAPLIGALPGEVLVADSTSVNLFKLLGGALRLRPDRRTILTVDENFPTDLYITQAASELFSDHPIDRVSQADLFADPDRYLSDDVCVVTLSPVDFRDGALYDIENLTRVAHEHGALVLWDLSHCVGVIPVDLHSMQADLAVGSTYKYLSGGPGAPAFLFIAERWRDALRPTLPGWMGHQAPFDFAPTYAPADGIERHLSRTPPILSFTALDATSKNVIAPRMAEALMPSRRTSFTPRPPCAKEMPRSPCTRLPIQRPNCSGMESSRP